MTIKEKVKIILMDFWNIRENIYMIKNGKVKDMMKIII